MGERRVRNAEVGGSIPLGSTTVFAADFEFGTRVGGRLHTRPAHVVRLGFGAVLQRRVGANHTGPQCGIGTGEGGRCVNPQLDRAQFLRARLRVVMRGTQLVHQRTGRTADRVGWVVAARQVSAVGQLQPCGQGKVAVREHGALIAGEEHASRVSLDIVTGKAVPVKNGLDVPRVVKDLGHARYGLDTTRRPLERLHGTYNRRCLGSILVAPDTGRHLAGHHRQKTQHAFHGQIVFIQGHEEQAPHRRHLKEGRPVGLDRDPEKREATRFIEKMMLSNKMAVIATFTDPGNFQCFDCGYGHDCAVGNVYARMGLVTAEHAEANRPQEYGPEAQDRARAIGKMLGSILSAGE